MFSMFECDLYIFPRIAVELFYDWVQHALADECMPTSTYSNTNFYKRLGNMNQLHFEHSANVRL